jgi:hypothetical protein
MYNVTAESKKYTSTPFAWTYVLRVLPNYVPGTHGTGRSSFVGFIRAVPCVPGRQTSHVATSDVLFGKQRSHLGCSFWNILHCGGFLIHPARWHVVQIPQANNTINKWRGPPTFCHFLCVYSDLTPIVCQLYWSSTGGSVSSSSSPRVGIRRIPTEI